MKFSTNSSNFKKIAQIFKKINLNTSIEAKVKC